ncbi:MAG: hypothetical protein J6P87_05590 [Lachnospiraceae bacterium]|nr:hypothetical protein [Lachnospiraceae bacterium]
MSKRKNNLDERQEQALLKIEHNGCWLAFWGLLAVIVVQQFIVGFDFGYIAGEWIIFMALCLYLLAGSMKNGIWDRHLKADLKTNILVSLAASVIAGTILGLVIARRYPGMARTAFLAGVLSGAFIFVLCAVTLLIMSRIYKKKVDELEKEPEE